MIPTYCWRCHAVIPMLDDEEWEQMRATLFKVIASTQELRQSGISFQQAMEEARKPAFALYREITGYEETNFNAIWHHYRSLYGPDCPACGIPFRTDRANFCAGCGFKRTDQ